jgi:hypothetical protein
MKRALIVAGSVFLVSYFISLFLGVLLIRHFVQPQRNVVQALANAIPLGVIFFVWKRKEHIYFLKIENYARIRRRWVHNVREKLQILMLRLDYDEMSKRTIRQIDEMLDQPLLNTIDGKYVKKSGDKFV